MSSVKVFVGDQSIRTSEEIFSKSGWHHALAAGGVSDVLVPGVVHASWSGVHNIPTVGIRFTDRNLPCYAVAAIPRRGYSKTLVGTLMGKKGLIAYRVKALRRSAQIAERLRGRIEPSSFNPVALEKEGGTRPVSRGRSLNAVVFRKAAQEAAVGIKGNKIMLTQYGTASAPSKPTNFDVSEESLINENANYRAYISELGQLAQTGFEGFVAYANGKRIALSKNFDALIKEIGTRQEDVLIQEVPAKVINFRQPFQVET